MLQVLCCSFFKHIPQISTAVIQIWQLVKFCHICISFGRCRWVSALGPLGPSAVRPSARPTYRSAPEKVRPNFETFNMPQSFTSEGMWMFVNLLGLEYREELTPGQDGATCSYQCGFMCRVPLPESNCRRLSRQCVRMYRSCNAKKEITVLSLQSTRLATTPDVLIDPCPPGCDTLPHASSPAFLCKEGPWETVEN